MENSSKGWRGNKMFKCSQLIVFYNLASVAAMAGLCFKRPNWWICEAIAHFGPSLEKLNWNIFKWLITHINNESWSWQDWKKKKKGQRWPKSTFKTVTFQESSPLILILRKVWGEEGYIIQTNAGSHLWAIRQHYGKKLWMRN